MLVGASVRRDEKGLAGLGEAMEWRSDIGTYYAKPTTVVETTVAMIPMSSSARLTFLLFLAITVATAKASWSFG
jgi:hypothetical protein